MYKFFFFFFLLSFKSYSSSILISKSDQCLMSKIYLSLPIDSFANSFLFDTIDFKDNKHFTKLDHRKTIGVVLSIPDQQIYYSIYLHPSDSLVVKFNDNCELSISSLYIKNVVDLSILHKDIVNDYLDLFLYKDLDSLKVFDVFEIEAEKLNKLLNIENKDIHLAYKNDLLLTLLGSMFREMRNKNLNLDYINNVTDLYKLGELVSYSLSNYGYYYYTSFFKKKNSMYNLNSTYFNEHSFLFHIEKVEAKKYMLSIQFVLGIKTKIPTILDDVCLAFEDIKDYISDSRLLKKLIYEQTSNCY